MTTYSRFSSRSGDLSISRRRNDTGRFVGGPCRTSCELVGRSRSRLLREFELQGQDDFVAHGETDVVERLVPNDAAVLAVDLRGRRDACLDVAPRILHLGAESARVEGHLLGDAVHRQVT